MKAPRVLAVPRARDDQVLEWLRLRAVGLSYGKIGKPYGETATAVRTTIERVIQADLAESGEDPQTVKGAYA